MFKIFDDYFVMYLLLFNMQLARGQNQTKLVRYDECGGILEEEQALVTTPNYPESEEELENKYENNLDCKWKKTTPYNNTLYRIRFWDMVLENRPIAAGSNETKCFDYLNITIASIGTLQFCRWQPPKEILQAKGPNLTLEFHSDQSDNYRGFMLAYQCISNHRPCSPNPCVYGECTPVNNIDFVCACFIGYTGYLCDIDINECESGPCQNGGTCSQTNGGGFVCSCGLGYEGDLCEKSVPVTEPTDPCLSNPCDSTGSSRCKNDNGRFRCICRNGYTGLLCQEEIDECESNPCLNDGACIDWVNSFECLCTSQWTGETCSIKKDACMSYPCEYYEVCEAEDETQYSCNCPPGYNGFRCGEDINECDSNPCLNGGVCTEGDQPDFYECKCSDVFFGINCDVALPVCKNPGIPFVNNDTEWKPGATLEFYCADGYHLNGAPSLTCLNTSIWTSAMPVCVDNHNQTVHFLPTRLSGHLIFLISLASLLSVILLSFSAWLLWKG